MIFPQFTFTLALFGFDKFQLFIEYCLWLDTNLSIFWFFFTRPCPSTCILPSGFVGFLILFNLRKICRFDEIYYTAPSLHCFCWLSNCSTFVIGGIQPDFDFILFSGKICGNAIVAIYLFQMKSKHCIEIHKLWIWNPSVEDEESPRKTSCGRWR